MSEFHTIALAVAIGMAGAGISTLGLPTKGWPGRIACCIGGGLVGLAITVLAT